ncbi:hypothetical protein DSO57_1002208 [Entomophthora muscae]|uniref:Uncharacterized protein n=2 Tax=Entomophthora muscae TaxID=34485 RepID=A0ACC2U1E4_9FUNG|nr:hypothetical protein DSO57_1026791 [Entomophthora muscae]KAJ9082690.1 hypothetical protein DSO57_1002208 [Entomophthora muscae]
MFSSTSVSVSLMFLLANSVLLVPSILIVISVLGRPSMRTGANLIVCQIAILDILYALWAIVWHSVKLADPSVVTPSMCSLDGIISCLCMLAWLYSATLCAYYRYHAVMYGEEILKARLQVLVGLQWVVPVFLTILIASTEGFSQMPSGGYCLLSYHNDSNTYFLFGMLILFVLVPTYLSVYFYIVITRQCIRIANLAQIRNTQQAEYYQSFDKTQKMPTSLYSCHSIAFRAVMHSSTFVLTFLPLGFTMVYELIYKESRSARLDAIVIGSVLVHKVLSPIVTLLINTSILNRVKDLIRL